jgi:hypothetical protein
MMPVEPRRRFVLGIDHQCKHGGVGADRTRDGVEQQRGAELPALIEAVDGETADQRRGKHRIARQFARLLRGQTGHRDARGGERGTLNPRIPVPLSPDDETAKSPNARSG